MFPVAVTMARAAICCFMDPVMKKLATTAIRETARLTQKRGTTEFANATLRLGTMATTWGLALTTWASTSGEASSCPTRLGFPR